MEISIIKVFFLLMSLFVAAVLFTVVLIYILEGRRKRNQRQKECTCKRPTPRYDSNLAIYCNDCLRYIAEKY